ncbi:hypothetical protein [Motiliproteus sp. SC1-56]|uniref:hypothetical protein n=1 Tax=Motiliproteus sp. SC1-56 TaxID=2799565 RepID=UPI001A8DB214|nr:hypothetical protein [Motiliproteus sp. SC1-56]
MSDVSAYRLERTSTANNDTAGVTDYYVGRPNNQEFFRTTDEFFPALTLRHESTGQTYLINPELRRELEEEGKEVQLVPYQTKEGKKGLWPISTFDCSWTRSALEHAERATREWIRVKSCREEERYTARSAIGNLPEPNWTDMAVEEIVAKAFAGRLIDSMDHPIIRQLRGEA